MDGSAMRSTEWDHWEGGEKYGLSSCRQRGCGSECRTLRPVMFPRKTGAVILSPPPAEPLDHVPSESPLEGQFLLGAPWRTHDLEADGSS